MLFTQLQAVETCDYIDETTEETDDQAYFAELLDESRPIEDYERWVIGLHKHLMKHDDINVATLALANLDSSFSNRLDHETEELILKPESKLKFLKQVAESLDANVYSLKLAQSMCTHDDVSDKCPTEQITEKLFASEPENMAIYLQDLDAAVVDDDAEMIAMILLRMSKTKYAHIMAGIPNEFQMALDEYLFEHPIPAEKDLELFKEMTSNLSEAEIESMQYIIFMSGIKMTGMMSLVPAMSPLFKACEHDQKHAKSCLKIADTLTNNSDSIMMAMLGYELTVKVNEQLEDEKAIESSQTANDKFKEYYSCLMENHYKQDDLDIFVDPIVQKLFIEGSHEGRYKEQTAVHLYEKYQKAGVENLTDPKSCGLRYTN